MLNNNFRTCLILKDEETLWKNHFLRMITSEFYAQQKNFILDESNKKQIALCFDWVVGNVEISLNKGLLLSGEVGTGKSCLLKATMKFCKLIYQNIYTLYVTADKISRLYSESGDEADRMINQLMTCRLLFIDDIGYEALKVFESYPIPEIIRERYDKKRITCITTNLTMPEIYVRYGNSFEDKLNEMCYLVEFKGSSKR